jgi:thiopeptide-type bacteriocin biosynthesis protein
MYLYESYWTNLTSYNFKMSITKTSTVWMVARLNYSEPWLSFLTKSVKPFVDSLTRTGIIERYYFERSYEGGAHIRLYFRCNPELRDDLVLPNLKEHFEGYFNLNPSTRRQEKKGLVSNNTLQVADYQPVASEWGGEVGLPIAERHFQSSSEAVLQFMAMKGDAWSPDDVLATAIEMHMGFADSVGMDAEEALRFFEYCLVFHSAEEFRVQYMEEFFQNQKEPLLEFHNKLWTSLKVKEEFVEDPYNLWLEQCYYTAADIRRTFRQRVLKIEAKFSALWTMYAKLLNMTNNRLGLFGRDESLVFYIMMRSLEKIESENSIGR